MASIKHTSTSTNIRSNTVTLTRDFNSNLTSNKYVNACCIDLTSNTKTVTINEDADGEPATQDYSDISSADVQNADQSTILIESTEEGEITCEDSDIDEINNEKYGTTKRKGSVIAVDEGGVPNNHIKIRKIEKLVISIRTNFEQDIPSSRLLYNNKEGNVQTGHKKIPKRKQKKHSKFKDFKIEKITKIHCSCCKCAERKARSEVLKRRIRRGNNGSIIVETTLRPAKKGHKKTRESPQVITKPRNADREESTLKSVGSQDRPIPECRRNCSRATRNYIPKYLVHCDRQTEKNKCSTVLESNRMELECISSDELNVSESRFSSFSLSDIESPETHTKKFAKKQLDLQIKEICRIEQKPVNSENIEISNEIRRKESSKTHSSEDTSRASSHKVEIKESEKEICHIEQKPVNSKNIEIKKSKKIRRKKSSKRHSSEDTSRANSHKVQLNESEKQICHIEQKPVNSENIEIKKSNKIRRKKSSKTHSSEDTSPHKVQVNESEKQICHIEQKPVNSENIEIKKSNETRRKKSSKAHSSEDTSRGNYHNLEVKESEKKNPNKNSQQNPLCHALKLVPIEKLLAPVYKIRENDHENLSENKMAKPIDTTKSDKVKPNGKVMPMQQSEPKITTNKKYIKHQEIDISVGSILNDRYETCEIVRRGSYSNIVRATDRQNSDNIVLLKILHRKKYSHTLYNLKRLNGIDVVDKYRCVRLKGWFFVNSHLALWLEDCGCNLQQSLERRSCGFAFATVQHLGRQLLMAVKFLREYDVLHGNIRPEHILMGLNDSNLKLTGFDGAISRNFKVKTNSEPGFVNYQAPEIILKRKFGYSVDIWSAACVIYEMAAGKPLFRSSTDNQVLSEIMNLQGQFPDYMRAGEHFHKGTFIMKYFNDDTGLEESKPIRQIASKRNLKTELSLACLDSGTREKAESKSGATLVNLLSMALHSMLLVEPSRRISADFALLNQFFQITP